MSVGDEDFRQEQQHLDMLYARLDQLRDETADRLADVRKSDPGGNRQARGERDAFATLYEDQLARLNSVEENLCFGRIDTTDAEYYIGRIGMSDEQAHQILLDWRAPAAEPFYQATPHEPAGLVRRRHLVTKGRTLTGVEDDVLDLNSLSSSERDALSGEGALLAALDTARTGRMSDIVATIQAEQDAVIRRDLAGALVVQGGPGTGKTAVALHRAAYLLYRYRDKIEQFGVLLLGPTKAFLSYIGQVLPSLGETGAVPLTPGELYPGVATERHDTDELAALKGDASMRMVLRKAVADRQRLPEEEQVLVVESRRVTLRPADVRAARDKARRTGKPHNEARVDFVKALLNTLTDRLAATFAQPLDDGDRAELVNDIRSARDVRIALNLAWMPLSGEKLLADLYSAEHLLASAAGYLTDEQRGWFFRDDPFAWTVEDVPLLDEAADLLGEDPSAAARRDAARKAESEREHRFAESVIEMTDQHGIMSPEALASRFADPGPSLTTAERAAADRTWAYGHVVVDEAQELSAMMWRAVARRVPSKSMTLVGDIAQTSSAAGTRSWRESLAPFLHDRFSVAELTINYRTPKQIMDAATVMIRAHRPDTSIPASVRDGDWPPIFLPAMDGADVVSKLPTLVEEERELLSGGTLAVIAPPTLIDDAEQALAGRAAMSVGGLDADVALLTPEQAKGLEFDGVVLCEPGRIAARSINDVYVSMTRPTRRLVIVHSQALPDGLAPPSPRVG